jgi:molybdenum storage protein
MREERAGPGRAGQGARPAAGGHGAGAARRPAGGETPTDAIRRAREAPRGGRRRPMAAHRAPAALGRRRRPEAPVGSGEGDELALGGSRHVRSPLMRDSLLSVETMRATDTPVVAMLPFIHVVKIGGRSIIDGGRRRLYPVVEELAENLKHHKLVIGAGAGLRSRHVFAVGLDLGLPTGVLAALASADAEENAHILAALLAPYGVVGLPHAQFIHLLPAMLAAGSGVVFNGVPPFELWEHPPQVGKIPPNRTDVGVYLVAEVYGARSLLYVKDQDGLYTADPKVDRHAEFIPRITVAELRARGLRTLVIDRLVLDLLERGKHCRRLQIVNGTKPGMITRALNGEHVGTIIEAEPPGAALAAARPPEEARRSGAARR